MERRLRLVVNNTGPSGNVFHKDSQALHLVPDSEIAIERIVRRFSTLMLEDVADDTARCPGSRRRFDTLEVIGAIYCLSPRTACSMKADLLIIAQLALHPEIRKAAVRKLAESELAD